MQYKPFLKWAGGKFKLVATLKRHFPQGLRFVEPFLGAGAASLNVDYPNYIVNDVNADLILVWRFLKYQGINFVDECEKLFVPENNTEKAFNELKLEFNSGGDNLRKAVLFVYLMRHCFNGLCRYNRSGKYNVPIGRYKKVYFPRKEFLGCLDKIKNFQIYNMDFREVFELVEAGDVVYCDPPYLSNFSGYAKDGFGLEDHRDLARCAELAADKGATVIISNNYTPSTEAMYINAKMYKVKASRTINSKVSERKPVEEIIAIFKGKT